MCGSKLKLFLFWVLALRLSFSWSEEFESLGAQQSSPSTQESAARDLLRRFLPTHLSSFELEIVPENVCGRSCFWITNFKKSGRNAPEIKIKGTTAVEIASGLHWYLKYWCGAHVSWEKTGGVQMASIPKPGSLPPVSDEGYMMQRPVQWSYYQNVVTSSYSYVWWDWERWEQEIDWMALQGVNLPLAFTGQEAIWQKVFLMGWAFITKLVGSTVVVAETDFIADDIIRHDPSSSIILWECSSSTERDIPFSEYNQTWELEHC